MNSTQFFFIIITPFITYINIFYVVYMLTKLTKHYLINSILWEATCIRTINYDTQSVHGRKLINFIDLFIRYKVVR